MQTTQDHLTIADIAEDTILLKSGGACVILQASAVNFDLLSEMEQVSIIQSFGQMLNSLSFPIQIFIRSKRLDITSYLRLLDYAISSQTNPLLSSLMLKYRAFVQSLIRQNEVLDKHFFVVLPVSSLELGLLHKRKEELLKKVATILSPRKEQITRQLARVGLKADQLNTKALVELFYDIYNPPEEVIQTVPVAPQPNIHLSPQVPPIPISTLPLPASHFQPPTSQPRPSRTHPFVVEELADSI